MKVVQGCDGEDYEALLGLCWLGLSGAGPVGRSVREHGAARLWRASRAKLVRWGLNPDYVDAFIEGRGSFRTCDAETHLRECGQTFVPRGGPSYPEELGHLQNPPLGLFLRGRSEILRRILAFPRMTVVGTRRASPEGMRAAESFVEALVARGVVVVSGMALGIDGQAHRTALRQDGLTIAVLGCGVDVVYPPRHRSLREAIVGRGVVASELPPGTRPSRWAFPHRNRLLAALGDAVLVVEGARTSGAMQTAKCALDIGRPVFAVPGSIYREACEGCNSLLSDGAAPALVPDVMVEEFLWQTRIERGARQATDGTRAAAGEQSSFLGIEGLDESSRAVLGALRDGPAAFDKLASLTGLAAGRLGAALGELETAGLVVRGGPGIYLRAP